MASCKDDNKTLENTTHSAASTATPVSTNASGAAPALQLLDTLWVDAAAFRPPLNAGLVFSFAIPHPDTLTLYGWICKGNSGKCTGEFDTHPDLKLTEGRRSLYAGYGPVVFWENVILNKSDVSAIQAKIVAHPNHPYVLFAPENKNGHIKYNIILSATDPTGVRGTSTLPPLPPDQDTQIDANPSPPKNTSN